MPAQPPPAQQSGLPILSGQQMLRNVLLPLVLLLLLLLLLQTSKDFLFSEVGLGGGQPDGRSTASDLQSLAENVENGIWAVYNTAQDPWQRQVRSAALHVE
jgi:hypothetical protein